jgi:hypothetical protein
MLFSTMLNGNTNIKIITKTADTICIRKLRSSLNTVARPWKAWRKLFNIKIS